MNVDKNGKNRVVTLLRHQELSRVELAKKTGLVKSALTKITQQLIQDGLIQEFEQADSNGKYGRPTTRLQLTKGINFSICFYISVEGLQALLIDQTNQIYDQIQEHWTFPMDTSGLFDADTLILKIMNVVTRLQHKNALNSIKVITIATQGKISQTTGIIHHSQLLKNENYPFASVLSEKAAVPVHLFNIAFCSTFQLMQKLPQTPNFIGLYLGYGLGAGVAINKEIVLGPDGSAPEISHLTYEYEGRPCHCGALGCTETYVTYQAIFHDLQMAGISLPDASVDERFKYIATLLEQKNEICTSIMLRVSKVITHIIIQMTNFFDVQTVILNGETSKLFSFLKERISEQLIQYNPKKSDSIILMHEEDNNIAFQGLIELTNRSYQI